MSYFRPALLLALLILLSACVGLVEQQVVSESNEPLQVGSTQPGSGGIGGTGLVATKPGSGGLGGTGKSVAIEKRGASGPGIGGTGLVADAGGSGLGGTGIVGTITGFGSIWVNDAHIHFEDGTPIRINNQLASREELRLGQVVAVLSDRLDTEYQARTIDVIHEVIGPLDLVEVLGGYSLSVLGQQIRADLDVSIYDEITGSHESLPALMEKVRSQGLLAKVSGYRGNSGEILATRIDVLNRVEGETTPFQVMGHLNVSASEVMVAGLVVEVASLLLPDDLSHRYMVVGHIDEGRLVVDDIGVDSALRVIEEAESFSIQGLAELDDLEDAISIAGMEIELDEEISIEGLAEFELHEELVQVMGDFDGDRMVMEDFFYFSEHVEDYIDVLHEIDDEIDEHELEEFEYDIDEFDLGEYEWDEDDHYEFEEFEEFED